MKIQSPLSVLTTTMSLAVLVFFMTLTHVPSCLAVETHVPPINLEDKSFFLPKMTTPDHRFLMAKISPKKSPKENARIAAENIKKLSKIPIQTPTPGFGFESGTIPTPRRSATAAKIVITSPKSIKGGLIQRAVRQMGKRRDFRSVYTKRFQIRRVNDRRYIVTLYFNRRYKSMLK